VVLRVARGDDGHDVDLAIRVDPPGSDPGVRDRVALARALVFTPDILLLDEPLSALDKKLRAELQWELKQIHQRVGTTFIYVTHDQEEALSMSDQIAIIRDGRIVQSGPPRLLYERPATRFVADFLGKSNFISGRVVALDGDRLVYEVAGCRYVQATAGAPRQVGDEIVVALRPEKVEIRKGPRSEDGENGIAGEISAWNYHGTSFHVLVETAALGELIVTAPAWHSEVEPEVGRRVHLVWSADAAGVVAPD
jgi:putative spermidine/putrescine transport system ATP-binding protein